jgi:hypothetical protein
MHKPNQDATAQRTKALAVAAKALEVVASLDHHMTNQQINLPRNWLQKWLLEVGQEVG